MDNKGTLLHFLAELGVDQRIPQLSLLFDQLKCVDSAAKGYKTAR